MTRRLVLALAAGIALCAGAIAEETAPATPEQPERFSVAVFLFADQTYLESMAVFEAGFRDIIAQTLAMHPRMDVVAPDRLDRAIRRAGFNPARPIPYGAAYRIAKELGASRAISGSMVQFPTGVRVEAQMVFIEDPKYQWTAQRMIAPDPPEAQLAAVELAREFLAAFPIEAAPIEPVFWVGSHVRVRLKSDSERATLTLVSPPEEAQWSLGGYRVLAGKTLGEVAWDPERRQVTVATAPGTTAPDWSVELDGVLSGSAAQLRFSVVATPGARVEVEVTNENLLGQPRTVKSYKMEIDTPSADVLVDGDAIRKDGPLYILSRAFAPYGDSVPLVTSAPAAPATGTTSPTT